jgi:hypothetical protein
MMCSPVCMQATACMAAAMAWAAQCMAGPAMAVACMAAAAACLAGTAGGLLCSGSPRKPQACDDKRLQVLAAIGPSSGTQVPTTSAGNVCLAVLLLALSRSGIYGGGSYGSGMYGSSYGGGGGMLGGGYGGGYGMSGSMFGGGGGPMAPYGQQGASSYYLLASAAVISQLFATYDCKGRDW